MNLFRHIRQRLLYKSALKNRRDRIRDENLALIDHLIETFGEQIPYLTSYRHKLVPLIQAAGRYFDKLINLIPGPVALDPDLWDRDPVVHSMFVSGKEAGGLIAASKPLQRFFRDSAVNAACALLTAQKREKSVSVSEQTGEIFRRDVMKKAVFFEGHRITAPRDTLAKSRLEVRYGLFSDLFAMAAEKISEINEMKARLEAEHDELAAKMAFYAEGSDQQKEFGVIHDEVEGKIKTLGKSLSSPGDYIAHLRELLREPERQISAGSVFLKLDRMGIVANDSSAKRIDEFSLAEFELSSGKKWVATWVSVGRTAVPAGPLPDGGKGGSR
ncbi:hypothetical protein DSCW_17020 [Desulfosarcina widdelii]|uniref:Uncharacterized protein n=1 Tax=Desulfosarcina widdelii TaxID=947919 RepID=A0A5K7Z0R6_9BACT|nr:hypothetical protein [Desulfosarcina widdelii]BBO74285.1 hypothetical protein DSCW_17020 [Desulfosarcina widdelii]